MTVADLIRELQALPNQHADVCVRVDASDFTDPGPDWQEVPVDDVRNEGPFVSIRTR